MRVALASLAFSHCVSGLTLSLQNIKPPRDSSQNAKRHDIGIAQEHPTAFVERSDSWYRLPKREEELKPKVKNGIILKVFVMKTILMMYMI